MPTLISLIFPSSSQLVICCFCWSTNCFAAGRNCTFSFQFFCHFQDFKFQQMMAAFGLSKDNRPVHGVHFLGEGQGKSKREEEAAIARIPRTKRVQQRSIDV